MIAANATRNHRSFADQSGFWREYSSADQPSRHPEGRSGLCEHNERCFADQYEPSADRFDCERWVI